MAMSPNAKRPVILQSDKHDKHFYQSHSLLIPFVESIKNAIFN